MTATGQSNGDAPLLRASAISKSYGHVRALDGVDFELRRREIHAIIGDNGAGKSTFIKILAGAVRPDAGTIEIDGRPVAFKSPADGRAAGIETVYQDLALAEPLDAAGNVYLGRELCYRGLLGRLGFVNRAAMRRMAQEHLRELAIDLPSLSVPVESMSGGQRQAVAVARAAAWGRRFLIMDEPVAALSVQQTSQVTTMMQWTRDEKGLSVILISHNMPEVLRVADRITVLRLGRRVGTVAAPEATTELLVGAMTGAVTAIGGSGS